ncbi:MAG: multidrug DMT transporter permease [Muribaculaceae bacterium]|nr:multidrug DMT transporter permease [Muribaculaceae bacterium]
MFIVNNYLLAVVFCLVTMICWGSWGNTQKLVAKNWRYELFYWDYVIGMLLFTLLLGFTLGSTGTEGRPFIADLSQASLTCIGWVILGGIIFNASNILLSASISLAGMSVAFPLGVGIALVLGVIVNYLGVPSGNPWLLFGGVILIVAAIISNGVASGKMQQTAGSESNTAHRKGIFLAIVAGVLMAFFYRFVVKGMDVTDFAHPTPGMLTPYSAIFIFAVGVLLSNFVFNTLVMRYPFVGKPVSYKEYFKGSASTHLCGMLGGAIWALGTAFSYIASGEAGPAVSYALGQGAPMVAAIWGVFVWHEFKGATLIVHRLLAVMFLLFIAGLGLIIQAGN